MTQVSPGQLFKFRGYWIEVPIASTEVSYSLPTSLPPLHCRPPRRVLPVEDGHPCYVDSHLQRKYFLVTPTKPWALNVHNLSTFSCALKIIRCGPWPKKVVHLCSKLI